MIPHEIQEILEKNPNIGRIRLANMTGISTSDARAYCMIFKRGLSDKGDKRDNNEPLFLDKKLAEKVDWREWFNNFREHQKLHQRISTSQDQATIELKEEKPIICFSGDFHMGSVATDYDELQENLEIILNTKGVYLITVGDLIDNFKIFGDLMPILSQIISPKEQKGILCSIVAEFVEKKKWLAACWGNHDVMRDERIFGESPVKEILGEHFIYFNGKGTLRLLMGKQEYEIILAHSLAGYSMWNPNHSMARQMRWFTPTADVICAGHKHQPAIQTFYAYGMRKNLIQVGTFLTDDTYSKRWYERGVVGTPAVVFHSNRHECVVYPSLKEYLEK